MRFRLPWGQAPPATAPQAFDALIDVDLGLVDAAGLPAVAAAVRGVPGAAWIDVARHRVPHGVTVRLFPPSDGREAEWPGLRATVEATVRSALPTGLRVEAPGLAPAADWFASPVPAAVPGFAEALSPFEALRELEALAASLAPPPASARVASARAADPPDAARAARLLGFVLPVDPAPIAQAAIRRFGSYAALLAAPEPELRQVPGLGTHCIAAIKLVHAAAIRLARAQVAAAPVLSDPAALAAYLAAALARERVEQFRILFLDAAGMLVSDEVQATGTVNHTPVYPREVVRRALQLGAAALVLVHNHPSGDPAPSRADLEMTRQVLAAAATMGIAVHDHIIVGNGRRLSFREAGHMG